MNDLHFISDPGSYFRAFSFLRRDVTSSLLRRWSSIWLSSPERLLYTPSPLISGDGACGRDMYRGIFSFGGERVLVGDRFVFDVVPPSSQWRHLLYCFSWLSDLRASNSEISRHQARSLIKDWIFSPYYRDRFSWGADIAPRRFMNFLFHASFLLKDSDCEFRHIFYKSLGKHMRYLLSRMSFMGHPESRIDFALALSYGSLCIDSMETLRSLSFSFLKHEISRIILPDGGHISRNPQKCVLLLLDFLPLARAFHERHISSPSAFISAIDRMLVMVRFLRHGDGDLAHFNGASSSMHKQIQTILSDSPSSSPLPSFSRHSGYYRLKSGRHLVLCDLGSTTKKFNFSSFAGALSFEFSEGAQRIIVNCGYSDDRLDELNSMMRFTVAHSTACLGNRSSAPTHIGYMRRFFSYLCIDSSPNSPASHMTSEGMIMEACHDGYMRDFGLMHKRCLWLREDGMGLHGEDIFYSPSPPSCLFMSCDFTIHFHLHPRIRATLSRDGRSVILLLPNRSGWRFRVSGCDLRLEESIYCAGREGFLHSQQIVLSGLTDKNPKILWALRKIPSSSHDISSSSPELPFEQ